jgi:hypothetical protein
MPTTDEYLATGWSAFLSGLGSAPYDSNLHDCFVYRFKSRLNYENTHEAEWLAGQASAVEALCVTMGQLAAGYSRLTTSITAKEFLHAAYDVAEAQIASTDSPTRLC